jgi:hypothetical protein
MNDVLWTNVPWLNVWERRDRVTKSFDGLG